MNSWNAVSEDVRLGVNVRLSKFINLYGCEIGDDTKIGAFVEIQKNARVGKRCKISSHSFICEGVQIEDNVFIGHGVMFINDAYPRATNTDGSLQTEEDWKVQRTVIGAWRFHRFQCDHSFERESGRKCDDWRGQRRHQGCPT